MSDDLHKNRFDEVAKGRKTAALIGVLSASFPQAIKDILVVGCGSGLEAGMLARAFGASVIGIDPGHDYAFDHEGSAPARLVAMDARDLKFPCKCFDLVFCFHALEHIPEPQRALAEMSRVLRFGGVYLIGTPNKSRLLGGYSSPYSLRWRVMWNLQDLAMRIRGRWSNEEGAHAGFTPRELSNHCITAFGDARDISALYYEALYQGHIAAIKTLTKSGLNTFVFPGVYIAGNKAAENQRSAVVAGIPALPPAGPCICPDPRSRHYSHQHDSRLRRA